ncbi:8705_t:CDS:2 [Funneliformis geosporum]|nr:8705_t:CDS:2 [Funneliformis geosporum]
MVKIKELTEEQYEAILYDVEIVEYNAPSHCAKIAVKVCNITGIFVLP